MTSAQERLRRAQENAPLSGPDRIAPLFEGFRMMLLPELNALYEKGDLVVGEVGEVHPAVRTVEPLTGGFSIEVTTGMFVYVDLIMRILSGRFQQVGVDQPADGQLEIQEVRSLIKGALKTYVDQTKFLARFIKPKFQQASVRTSDAVAHFRDKCREMCVNFMLAHELGHVLIDSSKNAGTSENEERDADAIGFDLFLPWLRFLEPRVVIAGAGLAIRLYVSLERFGLNLSTVYPPQSERLALLERKIAEGYKSIQITDEYSTTLVAYLSAMDGIDDAIDNVKKPAPWSVSRIRVNTVGMLLEVARGNLPVDKSIDVLKGMAAVSTAQEFSAAINQVCDYYWNWAEVPHEFIPDEEQLAHTVYKREQLCLLSAALHKIVQQLPDNLRLGLKPMPSLLPGPPTQLPLQTGSDQTGGRK